MRFSSSFVQSILRLSALAALTIFVGCIHSGSESKDEIIARVNGDPIAVEEFQVLYKQLRAEQDEISQKNPKIIEQLKTRALNEAIVNGLLRQEAAKKQVKIAKEEVEGRLANWKDSYPPGGFAEMLKKENLNEEVILQRIYNQLLIEKITAELFGSETLVSDEEMKQYYGSHENDFFRPERVHAFQIVVPTAEEAEKIKQEVLSDKLTFESAARQYSMSPDAAKGGDLGFFSKDEKIAAFNEAFKLAVGAISRPIQSRYGIHLLRVTEKQPRKKLAFQEAKNDIVKILRRVKEARVYREWVTKLLKDGEIYRNELLFARLS